MLLVKLENLIRHCGLCLREFFWRYNPGEFEDADYVVKFTINKTILSNTIMFFVVTSATGVTSALVTFHSKTNWLCWQIRFVKNSIRGMASRFWTRATTTASFFLENMHGNYAGSDSPMLWFSQQSIAVCIAEDTSPCDFSLLRCWKQILRLDGVEMVEFHLFEQTTHSCGPLYVRHQQRTLQHRQDIINHPIDFLFMPSQMRTKEIF